MVHTVMKLSKEMVLVQSNLTKHAPAPACLILMLFSNFLASIGHLKTKYRLPMECIAKHLNINNIKLCINFIDGI